MQIRIPLLHPPRPPMPRNCTRRFLNLSLTLEKRKQACLSLSSSSHFPFPLSLSPAPALFPSSSGPYYLPVHYADVRRLGMTFKTVYQIADNMRAAGFVDIVERKFIWPIGPWPSDPHLKDLGRWGERNWAEGVEGWVMALYTRVLGVSKQTSRSHFYSLLPKFSAATHFPLSSISVSAFLLLLRLYIRRFCSIHYQTLSWESLGS